ncbi:hypothetical protein OPQ81_011951 [Rhizoctonia solani]|nr:hypothetical protein OPQ81_011951 [Rhizoctonia solani]
MLPPAARLLNPYVVPGGKDEAVADEASCSAMVKIFTDVSMVGGHVGAAAVLQREGREPVKSREYVGTDREHEVYQAEVIGLLMGLELLSREKEVTEAAIFIDNQAVVKTTQAGTTKNLGYLYVQIDEAVRVIRERNV